MSVRAPLAPGASQHLPRVLLKGASPLSPWSPLLPQPVVSCDGPSPILRNLLALEPMVRCFLLLFPHPDSRGSWSVPGSCSDGWSATGWSPWLPHIPVGVLSAGPETSAGQAHWLVCPAAQGCEAGQEGRGRSQRGLLEEATPGRGKPRRHSWVR